MFSLGSLTAGSRYHLGHYFHTPLSRHMSETNLHCFAHSFAKIGAFHQSQRRSFKTSQPQKENTTMTKTMKIGLCLLVGSAMLTAFGLYASEKSQTTLSKHTDQLTLTLNAKVLDTITHSEDIPGLKAEEFGILKEDISKTWKTLIQKGVLEISGADKDVRPYFVALQGVIEHVLSCELQNDIKSLKGIIHTPMPATPLCSKGEVSSDLVDPAIENDQKRLFTVKARTTIVRDFLHQGGYLYIIYPKDGMAKRTDIQQSIYQQELHNYPNLLDKPLNCSSIPDELIGATYIFTDQQGHTYAFAIKMTQAKDPKENGNFGLWFGSLQNTQVSQRVNAVLNFIEQNGIEVSAIIPKSV
jgi:hypothetical protein